MLRWLIVTARYYENAASRISLRTMLFNCRFMLRVAISCAVETGIRVGNTDKRFSMSFNFACCLKSN